MRKQPVALPAVMPDDAVLNQPQARTYCGIPHRTWHKLRAKGELPEPIYLTARRPGWRKRVLDAWLESRRGGADDAPHSLPPTAA